MSDNMQLVYTIEIHNVNHYANESKANSWSFLRCSYFTLLQNSITMVCWITVRAKIRAIDRVKH